MKLAWLTDIHLNFVGKEERISFYETILKTDCDAVLITGDIAEAPSVVETLNEMSSHLKKHIYFVLGNHDYYRSSVERVREDVTKACQANSLLIWLGGEWFSRSLPFIYTSSIDCVKNHNTTVIVGQDGWADGRFGDYKNSRVMLTDSIVISDLAQAHYLGKYELLSKMQWLADRDAKSLENSLAKNVENIQPKKIIVLTHVPPFKEACFYRGRVSGDDYLPFYTCKAIGDVLLKIARMNPVIEFLVLCGHTHGEAEVKILDNLTVKAGTAEYRNPKVQSVIEL